MESILQSCRGFLFDLDGVFFVGRTAIPGAADAIRFLREHGIPRRYTTNTTTRSRATLHRELQGMGLTIDPEEIISAPQAAILHLRRLGSPVCRLLLDGDTLADFAEFRQSDRHPEVIVFGDIGNRWNYDLMNELFRAVMAGARMIALHKGRYWQVEDGLRMDIGAFVAGLEYVTGAAATVIGKPSREFFELALADAGLRADETAMIGDDLHNDVAGAQNAGLKGVLVRTGKYRDDLTLKSPVHPDLILDSIADLPALLR
ncbi:MAG: TIGR01458 family HAD-type hydrolase [Candidatus Zixiibacteriota bacterium]